MQNNDISYRLNPTDVIHPNERFSKRFNMYTADHPGAFKIQFHRFEQGSPLHPLIKSMPHVAFQVDNLQEAKVAMINDQGVPIKLVETRLSNDELWEIARKQED